MLEAECQCIDVVVIVMGRSLNELWCFGDNGVVGLQRHACVNLISVVVAMDGEEDHIPRAHFLGRSTTLMLLTSVSSSTSMVVMSSEGMDMESVDNYIRWPPIGRSIYILDLRRLARGSTGIRGAVDGANHPSMTSCGIRVLVTLWAH